MSWISTIPSSEPIIDEHNDAPNAPSGLATGWQPRNYFDNPSGFYAPLIDAENLIPRDQWYDRAKKLEQEKYRLSDFARRYVKVKHQGSTNYCWINGVVFACEVMRATQGQRAVELSPASGGSLIKDFRNTGGWGDQAAEFIQQNGLVPADRWPSNAIDRKYNKPQSWEIAERYAIAEWNELRCRNMDDLFTCLLQGLPVPVGYIWWRHLVCAMDVVVFHEPRATTDREMLRCFGIRIANSWGTGWGDRGYGILKGKKQLADGQLVIRSMRLSE